MNGRDTSSKDEKFPRRLGEFELLRELGRGGMGVVYAARIAGSEHVVALKLIRIGQAPTAASHLERFAREGLLVARLKHPGIVQIHSAGEAEGAPFLAYELVAEARSLEQALAPLAQAERVALFRQIVAAVAAAHRAGVVHRDLKPSNILVDAQGRARVCDFGLATASDLARLTRSEAFLGTPTHMAPEQLAGGGVDASRAPAVDVWALGILLYQLLTDRLPYPAQSLVELLAQVTAARIPPPSSHARVPASLDAVCLKALSRSLEDRYPSAQELLADLERVSRDELPLALEQGAGRRRRTGALALGALVLAVGGGALGLARWRQVQGQELRVAAEARLAEVARAPCLADQRDELVALAEELAARGSPVAAQAARWLVLARLASSTPGAEGADGARSGAIEAVLALEAGDLPSPEALDALRAEPLAARELATWIAVAELCVEWDQGRARRALRGAASPGEVRWRHVLEARLGRVAGSRPGDPLAREAEALSQLASAGAAQDALELRAAAASLPSPGAPLLAEWRQAVAQTLAGGSTSAMRELLARETDSVLSSRDKDRRRVWLQGLLFALARLDAGVTSDAEVAARFTTASIVVGGASREWVELLARAHPRNAAVQVPLLGLAMSGYPSPARCLEILPLAERALACAEGSERILVRATLAEIHWKLGRSAEGLAYLAPVLGDAPAELEAILRLQQARCLRSLGRYAEARAEYAWLLEQGNSGAPRRTLLLERAQLLFHVGQVEEACADLVEFLNLPDRSQKPDEIAYAWERLWRRPDRERYAAALRLLSERLAGPAELSLWGLRLALFEWGAGRSAAARRLLETCAARLEESTPAIAGSARRALDALQGGDPEPLSALVAELDRERVGGVGDPPDLPQPSPELPR